MHCGAMSNRSGVSLVEVLVAAVLLAVGIAGTMAALAAAAQLREQARAREELAAEGLERLAWFEGRACAQPDTSEHVVTSRAITIDWHVRDSLGRRQLIFDAISTGRVPQRLSLRTSWRCA